MEPYLERDGFKPIQEDYCGFKQQPEDIYRADLSEKEPTCPSRMAENYIFFTTGIWHARLHLQIDPVQEFVNQFPEKVEVGVLRLNKPIFQGLRDKISQDDSWNHQLLFCEKKHWLPLRNHLSSVAFIDRDKQDFYRSFYHRIRLVDLELLSHCETLPRELPYFTVVVFSAVTKKKGFLIRQGWTPNEKEGPIEKRLEPKKVEKLYPNMWDEAIAELALQDQAFSHLLPSRRMEPLAWDGLKRRYVFPTKPPVKDDDHGTIQGQTLFCDLSSTDRGSPGSGQTTGPGSSENQPEV